ncbi:Candidate transporter [Ramlibacter tataouinensis TTB310]|uniref:Candidate transporter n=1 Tax=Ramlibacter tataouinensis (strain ATCC BAA-407 / DSM 14655 / LMG 21543 / TTB310) TaxID=365046 RepID=F5Y3R8_RAMTT|nr:Candidate transporter [Ramlibacter tataouinensis TTB310]
MKDLAWASLAGSFSGGVILVAFALALGATPLQIGLLAAIPFIAQAAQLPATLLIERVRQRRRIGVLAVTAARVLILLTAVLPFLTEPSLALQLLIAAQLAIAALNAVGGCAVNSWLHQLIPPRELGSFFSRRLFFGTTLACIGTLAAGTLIDRVPAAASLQPYALVFALAALAGFVSSFYLGRAPEPVMPDAGPEVGLRERFRQPFRDRNFRRLLVFLAAWTIASNLAAPFLTVYLMEQRGYAVATVTSLWVTSQLANALTLYLWGRLSDRFSNKAVLAVALPVHFTCILALVFADAVTDAGWQLGLLYAIHFVMGIATGGIGLATGNLGLKLAPQGQGTAYLAAIGLASAVSGGIAPIAAGALAGAFQAAELSAVVRWATPLSWGEMAVVSFAHWEFLFAISALFGLYVMHALSRIDEGSEVSERQVVQEFALEAWRSLNSLSSVAGALGSLFPFERLTERRKWWRERQPRGAP